MNSSLATADRVHPTLASVGEARRTVAIIWQRFGPYHLARLRGAAEVLADVGWGVVGIEVAGRDHYDWSPAADGAVERHTLFPAGDYSALEPRDVRRQMTRTLNQLQPAAVCVNGWAVPEAVAALRWARSAGVRTILMSETFESAFNPLKHAVRRWRVGACDAAVVGGRLHADYLGALGFARDRMELGYDVVDNAHFAAAAPLPSWLPPVAARRYFFANTRLIERKGIDALLRAYARYRALASAEAATTEPWRLVVSGSGEMEQTWKALARTLSLGDAVIWPGFLQYDDLPAAYQSAGAFVHPARSEPWGLVVNEAAAAGLPLLIGRRVGAACELVRDGQNGFLLDPDDLESFAHLLLRTATLLDAERAAMGRLSQQIVSSFGPERFGHAVRNCLEREGRPAR